MLFTLQKITRNSNRGQTMAVIAGSNRGQTTIPLSNQNPQAAKGFFAYSYPFAVCKILPACGPVLDKFCFMYSVIGNQESSWT
jgi:hypothetical protein